jgi:hypothetical protein
MLIVRKRDEHVNGANGRVLRCRKKAADKEHARSDPPKSTSNIHG